SFHAIGSAVRRGLSLFLPQSRPTGKFESIRPVLSSTDPSTLWTEGVSAVITGACAGRAADKGETETWLRFLCDPLAFPWWKARRRKSLISSVWLPLSSSVQRCRRWRLA